MLKGTKKLYVRIIMFICVFLLVFPTICFAQNPIITNIYTADPSAHVWADGRLYVYPSHDIEPNQGCDLMDQYHVYSTTDMVNWVDHGEILRASQVPWGRPEGGFMWAPDCAYKNGIYYFYFPHPSGTDWGSTWKIGVATSTSPASGFTVQGYIPGLESLIDPQVFQDDDGQDYFYYGGGNICKGGKLNADMMSINGSMQNMTGLVDFHEATMVFKRNGIYYLTYADNHSDGTGDNRMCYATSSNPLGPWTYKGVYMDPTDSYCTHGSAVQYRGQWYQFYFNSSISHNDWLRSTCVDYLNFNADGTIQKVIQTTTGPAPLGTPGPTPTPGPTSTPTPTPPPTPTPTPPPPGSNVAAGKSITANGYTQNFVPTNANDGNVTTYWEGAAYPNTLTVDLANSYNIGSIKIKLNPDAAWATRTQTLSVLGSTDGSTYNQLVGMTPYVFNPGTSNTVTINFGPTNLKYVRLNFTANTGAPAGQVAEFEVITSGGATPTPTNTPAATPTPTNTPAATPTPTNTPAATPTPTNTPAATPTPTNTPAATPTPVPGQPDLIVTNITWTPASPATGNEVTFSAVIKNQGGGASPSGVKHGLAVSIDGTVVNWCDNYNTSIAPNGTVTLTCNGGPNSKATWTATNGTHTVRAFIDDVSIIAESNENNNTMDKSITVGSSSTPTPTPTPGGNLALGKPITASSVQQTYVATNANDGNVTTYWEAAPNTYPNTLTVDLGSAKTVTKVTLKLNPNTSWATRTQTLSILGSTDNVTYTTIVNSAAYTFNPATANTVTITFTGTSKRYIRLNFTANTGSTGAQIAEYEVY
jgi:hypothetical protein